MNSLSSEVHGLQAFVAVARLGSVGRAAEALRRTQPSVSARLANLESAWRTSLFVRRARGMTLTAEGERLLPLAEAALRAMEAVDAAAGIPVGGAHALRVGSGDALGREVLPHALSALLRESPDLSVRFVEGPGSRLLQALRSGEIDVALVVAPDGGSRMEGLSFRPLLESRVDLLYPPGIAPRGQRVRLQALDGERQVTLQSGSGFRRRMERLFDDAGVRFEPAVEVGNLSLVRRFVAAGAGLAAVPAIAFDAAMPGPRVERRRLEGAPPIAYVSAFRAEAPVPDAVRRFLQFL